MGTPFPWLPMLAIAIGLVSHSYSLSSLFPYVGYMVQHLGATNNKDEAGYYAGYLSSAFMIGRFASSYLWGRAADRYGRLPVMYIGLGSIALCSVGFGLSTAFWWAVSCRFLLGFMNGLVAIGKCLISEVCGKEHETVGMSFITGCWSIGMVFGPACGGLLAETTNSGLFGRFPYLLPNLVGACLALIGVPMVFFFVEETAFLDNGSGSGGSSRAEFKPVPTSESVGLDGTDIEEGAAASLEMTPLTQADSLDHDSQHIRDDRFGDDDEENLAVLLGDRLERSASGTTRGDGGSGSFLPPAAADASGCDSRSIGSASAGASRGDDLRSTGTAMLGSSKHKNAVSCQGHHGHDGRAEHTGGRHSGAVASDHCGDGTGGNASCSCSPDSSAPSCKELWTRGSASSRDEGRACRGVNEGPNSGRNGRLGDGDESGTFEGQGQTTRTSFWREFLLPVKLLQEKRVRAILFVYSLYSFASIGWGEVYPLWALSTIANGGLDWTTEQIGQVLSLCGAGMLIFQLLVYPWLSKRMGVTKTQRFACLLAIPVYAAVPLISRLRNTEVPLIAASITVNFLSSVTATAVFINVALATNNAVDPSRRGAINGLSMMLGSLAKASGPAFFSAIFAWSINGNARPFPLDHHLVFYLLALSAAAVSWASWNVITDDAPPPSGPEATRVEG